MSQLISQHSCSCYLFLLKLFFDILISRITQRGHLDTFHRINNKRIYIFRTIKEKYRLVFQVPQLYKLKIVNKNWTFIRRLVHFKRVKNYTPPKYNYKCLTTMLSFTSITWNWHSHDPEFDFIFMRRTLIVWWKYHILRLMTTNPEMAQPKITEPTRHSSASNYEPAEYSTFIPLIGDTKPATRGESSSVKCDLYY